MSYVHLLSIESQLSEFYESERGLRKEKENKKLSKRTQDLDLFKAGLQKIGKTANGKIAFLKLDLSQQELSSIVEVDLSNNSLVTLKQLGSLKHLAKLNVANNHLRKLFDFTPPANLKYADYSNNEIIKIENVAKNPYLETLILNNNTINMIENIEENRALKILNLNMNFIEIIDSLGTLNIHTLLLSQNRIKMITGVSALAYLTILDLSRNKISKLQGLEENEYLRFLNLAGNEIDKIRQILYIEDLPLLTEVDLSFNPVQNRKYYRLQILYRIPQLRSLDGLSIIPEEKVKAENLHGLDVDDRKTIFQSLLPQEEFVERRIKSFQDIDPESDDDSIIDVEENLMRDEKPSTRGSQLMSRGSAKSHKSVTEFQSEGESEHHRMMNKASQSYVGNLIDEVLEMELKGEEMNIDNMEPYV